MIGVLADPSETSSVKEFFELFKTPWEFFRPGRDYDAIICSGDHPIEATARLIVIYSAPADFPGASKVAPTPSANPIQLLSSGGDRIPIYGECVPISGEGRSFLCYKGTSECAGLETTVGNRTEARVGYNLFQEIRHLLGPGQPTSCALYPTLDLHVSILRDLLLRSSVPFAEIPPVPLGYRFIACLTHDVDHPALRNHFLDHTMFGFIYRATIGSILDFLRGRKSFSQLVRNWATSLSLPFIYSGLKRDPWDTFSNYLKIEAGSKSTFFVIPRKNDPGKGKTVASTPKRAAQYEAAEIADNLRILQQEGNEVALHGIDAWCDAAAGRDELNQLKAFRVGDETGVRMHWLYFDSNSPAALERAGFSYDSTSGYNETVGCRAGTFQAFRPLGVDYLLELPLHVMDTALFFPDRLGLRKNQASDVVQTLIQSVTRFGGAFTINWHDRSLAPERCWDEFYIELIEELKKQGAWITSAGNAVAWFRSRRAATIQEACESSDEPSIQTGSEALNRSLPGLRLVAHNDSRHSTHISSAAHVCAA